jgi:hypothetical protein
MESELPPEDEDEEEEIDEVEEDELDERQRGSEVGMEGVVQS